MTELHPLAAHSTATISDALDRLGRPGSMLGIAPLFDGARLCGRAFTVRYVTATSPPGTVGDYLDDVGPGEVVVLDNGGRVDCTVWGDILTAMADNRGVAGTVIDGVCRDVQRALGLGYPIYSRGRFMRTGKDRVEVSDVGTPVSDRRGQRAGGRSPRGRRRRRAVGAARRRGRGGGDLCGDLGAGGRDRGGHPGRDEPRRGAARSTATTCSSGRGVRHERVRRRPRRPRWQRSCSHSGRPRSTRRQVSTASCRSSCGRCGAGPAWSGRRCRSAPLRGTTCRCTWLSRPPVRARCSSSTRAGAKHGYWGEVLAVAAQQRGVAGLVIDGGVRDTEQLEQLRFPVFSSVVALAGHGEGRPGLASGEPLTLGSAPVARGDIVVADRDGVVVLPVQQFHTILAASTATPAEGGGVPEPHPRRGADPRHLRVLADRQPHSLSDGRGLSDRRADHALVVLQRSRAAAARGPR